MNDKYAALSEKRLKFYENNFSTSLRTRFVPLFIFSFFDYYSVVFIDLTDQQKLKLNRLMNACVRFIFSLRKTEHVSYLYRILSWLDADDRRICLVYYLLFSIFR